MPEVPAPAPSGRLPAVWLRHDASLLHDVPGHPERPDRIRALEAEMARRDWFGMTVRDAPRATIDQLLAVHEPDHLAFLESLAARGGGPIDGDTWVVAGTWEAALRAAGGAVAMVDALLGGEAAVGVSALRPPGHHAEPDRAMGFCYFDNVAVAARHAVLAHGVERVLILDWDVHHGNGTAAAFAGDPSVLVVSIHQWPLYPGTGDAESVGTGPGAGYTINLPVPPGTGDAVFLSLVEHVACPLVAAWRPQLVLVSAGFDAHAADPLADCRCTAGGYAAMTAALRRASDAVGAPLGLVLEGGYDLDALTASVAALLPELLAAAPTAGGAGARAVAEGAEPLPIALAALARLEPYWPRLNDYLGAT